MSYVLAEDLIFHAFLGDAKQAGERIGRQRRLPPLDDVALVVVMRRLNQEEQEASAAAGDIRHSLTLANWRPASVLPRDRRFWRRRGLAVFNPNAQSRPTARGLWPLDGDAKKVAGIDVVAVFGLLFWLVNKSSSSFWRSAARPFFSAASNAFIVGP